MRVCAKFTSRLLRARKSKLTIIAILVTLREPQSRRAVKRLDCRRGGRERIPRTQLRRSALRGLSVEGRAALEQPAQVLVRSCRAPEHALRGVSKPFLF